MIEDIIMEVISWSLAFIMMCLALMFVFLLYVNLNARNIAEALVEELLEPLNEALSDQTVTHTGTREDSESAKTPVDNEDESKYE